MGLALYHSLCRELPVYKSLLTLVNFYIFPPKVWSRPITPVASNGQYSYAVAFVSRRADGAPYPIKFKLSDLNLTNSRGYSVTVSIFLNFLIFLWSY